MLLSAGIPFMKPNQLHAFAAVAAQLSIRGAARVLGISQPAVTKIVRELERELSDQTKENRELLKLKIDMLRERIESERSRAGRVSFN